MGGSSSVKMVNINTIQPFLTSKVGYVIIKETAGLLPQTSSDGSCGKRVAGSGMLLSKENGNRRYLGPQGNRPFKP